MSDEPSAPSWLSYAEAGERLGLSADAVRVRARRGKWRRMTANDGRTLVQVPEAPDERSPGRSPARGGPLAALQEAVTALREQLQAERTRSDMLFGRLTEAESRARDATEAARIATDGLRTARQTEAIRKAKGRWARLQAAWRGE
jgi:hypothetical protein